MLNYHQPVMLQECIEALQIQPNGIYVDVTFGGGGHSRAILKQLNAQGKLVAFDQDIDAQKNLITDERFLFVDQNFAYLKNHLRLLGITKVDGILADLGVSSHQFDEPNRGFSIRFDAELDMRMNIHAAKTAKEVINQYSETTLHQIFGMYGEVKNAKNLAKTIVSARSQQEITTTQQLKEAIADVTPKHKENKYLAQVFQALRIEVNGELDVLKQFLEQSASVLKPQGRLVVMSYHSLEDRLVKQFIAHGKFSGVAEKDIYGHTKTPFQPINRKAIVASEQEISENSRARSAKLRIAEKNESA